jgi:hypothetical protein
MGTFLSLIWGVGTIYLFYKYGWRKWQPWAFMFIVAYAINPVIGEDTEEGNEKIEKSGSFSLKKEDLTALQGYINSSKWICTGFEKGSMPFIEGATFKFSSQNLSVYNDGTTANNNFTIKGIVPNFPEGCKYSALVQVNDNEDVLTLIDESLMVLGWGGGAVKLRLQRQ